MKAPHPFKTVVSVNPATKGSIPEDHNFQRTSHFVESRRSARWAKPFSVAVNYKPSYWFKYCQGRIKGDEMSYCVFDVFYCAVPHHKGDVLCRLHEG